MNWLIFSVNALFQIHILPLWLLQILVWIGRRAFNAVEVHIWSYYTFSKYFSVWGRVLLNGDCKIKHRSWLVPKDDMRHRCRSRQIFGVWRIFAQISVNLPKKNRKWPPKKENKRLHAKGTSTSIFCPNFTEACPNFS